MGVVARAFVGLESAPENRTDPQGVEIVRGDEQSDRTLGPVADAECGPDDLAGDERVEQRGAPLKIDKVRP